MGGLDGVVRSAPMGGCRSRILGSRGARMCTTEVSTPGAGSREPNLLEVPVPRAVNRRGSHGLKIDADRP